MVSPREGIETDLESFARLILPHHLRHPFARFHRTLFDWHLEMGREALPGREGRRYALAAPRGSAKSTIASLLLVLHDIAFEREKYVLLVSATQRQAQQRLRALREELGPETALAKAFPGRLEADVAGGARVLEAGGVRVEAFGAGAEMRGISWQSWRPTKIVLDDAESSASAQSPRRRTALLDWFHEVVEHLGAPYTHLMAVGTVMHPAGLLARLLARPDFTPLRCRAIERFAPPSPLWEEWRRRLADPSLADRRGEARRFFLEHRMEMERGAEVLWPEHEDFERLFAQMILQGRRAFYQEKQNEPLGPEDALFDLERTWRARRAAKGIIEVYPPPVVAGGAGTGPAARYVEESLRLFGYHDAALCRSRAAGRGDFAALATVALADDGQLILLSLWVRRAPPSLQVQTLFEIHESRPFERLAVEGTGFQELLTMPIEEERKHRRAEGRRDDLPVEVFSPRKSKEARIATLEPLLTGGRLVLAEDLPEEFWTELARHPRADHDDALDAAAGAVELAMRVKGRPLEHAQVLPRDSRRGTRGAF